MAPPLVTIFSVMLVTGAAHVTGRDVRCCEEGELVRLVPAGEAADDAEGALDAVCWSVGSNSTSPLRLNCSDSVVVGLGVDYETAADGTLYVYSDDLLVSELEVDTYCLGNVTPASLDPRRARTWPALCYQEEQERVIQAEVLGYCMLVSSVFFFVTGLIYCLLPELRDIQGKSIINICVCFCIGLLVLGITSLMEYSDMGWCAARGMLAYFFLVAGFFWLTTLAVQILISIRCGSGSESAARWWAWCAGAWGAPALLALLLAAVNFAPGRHPKPGIGLNHCWFINAKQQWLYMYSVVSALLAVNVCAFLYCASVLWRQTFTSSNVKALKYKFSMTFRLFILTGLPWVFEMISSVAPRHILLELADVVNALQGALVFALLVAGRARVRGALARRAARCCCRPRDSLLPGRELAPLHTELPVTEYADA